MLDWEATVGYWLGVTAAALSFVGVYLAAVASVGWVLGIALGWIPAGLAAVAMFFLFKYLWWLVLLAALIIFAALS